MVPEAGLEPARTKSPRDFKSLVSTNSTTPANNSHEEHPDTVVTPYGAGEENEL